MSASTGTQQRMLSPSSSSSSPSSAAAPSSRFFPFMNSCHCLNMQLGLLPLSSPRAQQSAAAVSDFFTQSLSSPFLSHSCLVGQLESKQIQLEALTLVTAIAIPSASPTASASHAASGVGWVLFRCLGCHMDTFAVEDSATSPRCVINLALAVDAESAMLRASPQYSAVFNICIPTPAAASSLSVQQSHTPRPHSSSSSPSSAVGSPAVVESLRSALEHSIDAERVAMQMRVNQFVAEESGRFSQYERRGRRELAQLVAFISEEDRAGGGGNSPQPASVTPSRSPASPRISLVATPALPASGLSSSVSPLSFQPLATFLRRPSCQSPRLQRLLMDGLKHSTSTIADEHAADALSASGDGEEDEDGSTGSRPSSSSSAALTLNMGKLSPRQSVVVAVPQLSSLMRKGSRHQEDDSGEEEELLRSQELIVRWREQEDEREREEKKRKEHRKQKRRKQITDKAGRDKAAGDAEHDDEEAESAIFQLDSPTAEDTWTDMQLDSESAGRRRKSGDEVLIISTIPADEKEEKAAVVKELSTTDDDKQEEDGETEGEEDGEDEEATDAAQDEEDGSLSDDEAVAKTSQADIIAIARSSVVSSIPIPPSASAARAARAAADRDVMVPSSLPIPIPTALRQLVNKSSSPSTASSTASPSAAASASSHRLPSLTFTVEGARRDSLHALAAQRRSAATSQPPTSSSSQRAVSLIPEHEPQAAAAGDEDAGSASPLPHSPPSASSPFIPPHTLTEEPFFSFAKYRHLPGVRGGAAGGGGGGGGMLSSSLPSTHAGAVRQPTGWMGAGVGGGVLFRKEETSERTRAGAGVSGLTAALGRREGVGTSSRSRPASSSTSAEAKET